MALGDLLLFSMFHSGAAGWYLLAQYVFAAELLSCKPRWSALSVPGQVEHHEQGLASATNATHVVAELSPTVRLFGFYIREAPLRQRFYD